MIIFKTKKIKELERQIKGLNQENKDIKELNKVFYGELIQGDWGWNGYRKHMSIASAVKLLLEYFNIDFKHIPSSPESFKVVSTKGKKKKGKP